MEKKNKGKKNKVEKVKQPVHRDNPKGKIFDTNLVDFGISLLSSRSWDLTLSQVNAFRKMLKTKNIRRAIKSQSQPYLTLTKKPSEVRMGKGRGVKVNRVVNPLVQGSVIFSASFNLYHKNPFKNLKLLEQSLAKAGKKFPPKFKIRISDL